MSARTVITVDGLAGTGKSTLSRMLAERLQYIHFSTGAVYRAAGYIVLENGADPADEQTVLQLLEEHQLSLVVGSCGVSAVVKVDGRELFGELQSPEVSQATSQVSSLPTVRKHLASLQREAFPGQSMVVEGRDVGTVIFPDAPLKFFIKVSQEVAIQRRLAQLSENMNISDEAELAQLKNKMKIEISERDKRDLQRAVAPTRPAESAIIIDNSSETLTQVVQNMYDAAAQAGLI
jgi:cytidylate kinase